jgi:ElaB/YqjD/DUF883 family membrane-anchored ribosome-binding protein
MSDTTSNPAAAADASADLTATARDALDSGMRKAREAAGAAGEWASDWASEAADAVSNASVRSYRTAEDTIRIYPVMSVSIALVAGVVIGALLFARDR